MIETPGLPLTILAFAMVIGPLVFVHELGALSGRALVRRACRSVLDRVRTRIRGLGPTGFGTRWKLGLLPLGGYVKFKGDMGPAGASDPAWLQLPPEERARTFQSKPIWQRVLIVAAGPAVNFLLAVLILAGFAVAYGESRTPTVVAGVIPHSAAAAAGIRPGDRIVSLGGESVDTFDAMVRYVQIRAGERVEVRYIRDGAEAVGAATIGVQAIKDRFGNEHRIGLLGLRPTAPIYAPVGLLAAPAVAVRRTGEIVTMMVATLKQVVTGQRSVKELGGPISIARVSGEQLTLGIPEFVFLIALVSINLGFINLLPVPMLDGGHLLFYAIEAIKGGPVGAEAQEWAFRGGLFAVLALMLLVTFNDLGALGLWRGLAGLIG